MEEFEFGHWTRRRGCGGLPVPAGLMGMATALGLSWLTETSWPIDVGGLPIFAWWPNLIITFELTMLGAILATVTTLVVTARLGRGSDVLRSGSVRRTDSRRRRQSLRVGDGRSRSRTDSAARRADQEDSTRKLQKSNSATSRRHRAFWELDLWESGRA